MDGLFLAWLLSAPLRLYKGEDGKLVETGSTGFAMIKSPAGKAPRE